MPQTSEDASSGLTGEDDRSLSERVAEELHHRILTGVIPLGSRLRQDAVAAEFQVSRMPVREAFRALQGQGVLEILPRRGALVHGPTPRDIRDAHEVRAELEGMGAELAAERIDDRQLARLDEAAGRFAHVLELAADEATADQAADAWRAANEAFHTNLIEAADNLSLTTTIQELRRRIPHNASFVTMRNSMRLLEENAADHVAIYEAIAARDGKRARRLAHAHVKRSGDRLARRYERELEGARTPS
jgi:DNA-binding GntR family transcriptional regulator